jgi:rRNA biogenesis protein RRP5
VLSKKEHIGIISKFGQLEFKYQRPESGRTMFEGIVNTYPKRMDIWTVYLNLEAQSGNK